MRIRSASVGLIALLVASSAFAASKPRIVETTAPAYPEASRRAQEHGDVLVRVVVSKEGAPLEVTVARSSGFPALDAAAVEAVRGWKFAAALDEGGKPVEAPLQFKVQFNLDDSPPPPVAFDEATKLKIENEWYSLIDLSTIVDRTWRHCRSLTEPASSVKKYQAFFDALAPEISARESYLHLYFKDASKDAVDKMLRDEHQFSAGVIALLIENVTLNNKSPKVWCEPLTAGYLAAIEQFMSTRQVDWTAPELARIKPFHLPREKPLQPHR